MPHIPTTQTVGTLFDIFDSGNWDTFNYLARNYKIEGADQSTLCLLNAEVRRSNVALYLTD